LNIMRRLRGRGWMIDVFLWVCSLAGITLLVTRLLAGRVSSERYPWKYIESFDLPSTCWIVLSAGATLVPLTVAFLSRRAVGFLAGVSMLLLAITATTWLRSHWVADHAALAWFYEGTGPLGEGRRELWLISTAGQLRIHVQEEPAPLMGYRWRVPGFHYWTSDPLQERSADSGQDVGGISRLTRRLGFTMAIRPYWKPGRGGITFALALPYWFLCLLATPLPLAWAIRHRRRRRAARRAEAGACAKCGYDLRATPDPDGARLPVCPECGIAVHNVPTAATGAARP
jgi:hypothetical protein